MDASLTLYLDEAETFVLRAWMRQCLKHCAPEEWCEDDPDAAREGAPWLPLAARRLEMKIDATPLRYSLDDAHPSYRHLWERRGSTWHHASGLFRITKFDTTYDLMRQNYRGAFELVSPFRSLEEAKGRAEYLTVMRTAGPSLALGKGSTSKLIEHLCEMVKEAPPEASEAMAKRVEKTISIGTSAHLLSASMMLSSDDRPGVEGRIRAMRRTGATSMEALRVMFATHLASEVLYMVARGERLLVCPECMASVCRCSGKGLDCQTCGGPIDMSGLCEETCPRYRKEGGK